MKPQTTNPIYSNDVLTGRITKYTEGVDFMVKFDDGVSYKYKWNELNKFVF